MKSSKEILEKAELMIQQEERVEAERLLRRLFADIPPDWKPVSETPYSIDIAYWYSEEFLSHAPKFHQDGSKPFVTWTTPSYSKAFYLLAFLKVEQKRWSEALEFIEQGLLLEPDHPLLWCEKALILSYLHQHEEAYRLFMKAASIRPLIPDEHKARALRGAGVELIDLNRLDEAEALLKESLKFDPVSAGAQNEVGYIKHLRNGKKPTEKDTLYTKPRPKLH